MSGRDTTSTKVFADVVDRGPASAVVVWDPVLSDTFFTDTKGKCWKQSKGTYAPWSLACCLSAFCLFAHVTLSRVTVCGSV